MLKPVKKRLEELAWDISSIRNFNYAGEYGNTEKGIKMLIIRLMRDFPNVYGNNPINPNDFFGLHLDSQIPKDIDTSKISEWERDVNKRLRELRSNPNYKALLQAYRKDDQKEISKILPLVFAKHGLNRILEPEEKAPRLYHGMTIPDKEMTPEDYLNLCLKIQKQGLKPSPYGLHCDMDKNIRPIYFALSPLESHGLLSLSFIPNSKTVVVGGGREARIYTKNLKTDFSLNLRDAETLVSYAPDNNIGIPTERTESYCSELKNLLKSRKIQFNELKIPTD